jgi:hypothetical protein
MTAPTIAIPQQRSPSIAFPLVLITLGVAFLAANAGYLQGLRWSDIFRLWPVLLVLAGVDIMLKPRSFVAAAVVEIAIIAAAFAYLVSGITFTPTATSFDVSVPRAGASELTLTVNYGGGALTFSGGGTDLVAVRSTRQDVARTVDQSGARASVSVTAEDAFWMGGPNDRRWEMTVPSDVRTGMTLNLGAGDFDVDLSAVQLTRATINAGASDLWVRLPQPKGDVPITISTGASSVVIEVPTGVQYTVMPTSVLGSVSGRTQSDGYASATDRVTIKVSAGMSSVTIR